MHPNVPQSERQSLGSIISGEYDGNWFYAIKAKAFIASAIDGDIIATILEQRCIATLGLFPSKEEKESWRNSLPALARVMKLAQLNEQIILLEYCPPSRDNIPTRIDAVICGADRKGQLHAILIELKQWANMPMKLSDKDGYIKIQMGRKWINKRHPRKQAEDYRNHMQKVMSICGLDANYIIFHAYAYLHNAINLSQVKKDILFGNKSEFDEDSRLYTNDFAGILAKKFSEFTGAGKGEGALVAIRTIQNLSLKHLDKLPIRPKSDDNWKKLYKRKIWRGYSGWQDSKIAKFFWVFVWTIFIPLCLLIGGLAYIFYYK